MLTAPDTVLSLLLLAGLAVAALAAMLPVARVAPVASAAAACAFLGYLVLGAAVPVSAAFWAVPSLGIVALAALGLARLTDPFMRMHAAAKAGAAGAGLLLIGAGLALGTPGALLTALAAVIFLLLTVPIASHALGRAAYVAGAPLGAASMADALSGVLHRKVFDIDPARTLRTRPMRAPSPEETPMSAIPEFKRPAVPVQQDQPATEPVVLRRLLVCLVGGPAQSAATVAAMRLAGTADAAVTGLSGAGLEPRIWRGALPVGGAGWRMCPGWRGACWSRSSPASALGPGTSRRPLRRPWPTTIGPAMSGSSATGSSAR